MIAEDDVVAARQRILDLVGDRTICSAFLSTARRKGDAVAIRWLEDVEPRAITWSQYLDAVGELAVGLTDLGIERGDRIGFFMRNAVEFHLADMAALFAGATPFSIYTSSSSEQVRYALAHSDATAVVVGDEDLLARVLEIRDTLPRLQWVILARGSAPDAKVLELGDLRGAGRADLDDLAGAVRQSDLATIIYTSGTTGAPKGVMLTQLNVCYAVVAYAEVMGLSLDGLRQVSYLPMAHIAERQATHYFHVVHGSDVTICDDLSSLVPTLCMVRPQWWFCAPRFWEKLRSGIDAALVADTDAAESFESARQLGLEVFAYTSRAETVPDGLAARWDQARRRSIEPVLSMVGLDAVLIANSGSAPMPQETFDFFLGCGLPLSDGYGLSETSGIATWEPRRVVPGTSGRVYPGLELELADDGEVLIRGPLVFPGYLNDPERTGEVLDADGWFHTGDIGVLTDGYLKIVDRKKELLIPTTGHNVSPALLEAALKESPLIGQACAIGDGRPFIAALLVLDNEVAPAWAREHGVDFSSMADLASAAAVAEEVRQHVERVNERFANAERIRRFRLLGDEWSLNSAFLTPTGKLKRRAVNELYGELIDTMYADR